MAKKTPKVTGSRLTFYDEYKDKDIFVLDIIEDWQAWQAWLEQDLHKNFRFITEDGKTCGLHQEPRPSYGRSDVIIELWYAHKRLRNQVRKIYVGKSENLTHKRLTQVTNDLNMSEGWWQRRKDKAKKG